MKSDKISVFGPEKDTSGAKQQLLIIHGAVLGAEAERRLIAEIFFFKVWPVMEPRHLEYFKLLLQNPTWQLDFSSDLNLESLTRPSQKREREFSSGLDFYMDSAINEFS